MSTECCIRLLSAAFLSVLKDLWRILNFVKKIEHLSSVYISKEISMRLVRCLSRIHFSGGGVGRGIKTSRFSYLTFSCPFILGFLPVALVYRLQNTKNYGVNLSPSHFFLSPFPYPPPPPCSYSPDIPPPCLPSPHFPKRWYCCCQAITYALWNF